MNIVVPIKILPDDQDIVVRPDRTLDDSRACRIVSTYDLNALEVASRLAADQEESRVIVVSVADAKADDSKLKKDILSRGADELCLIADDSVANIDAHQTALVLAKMITDLKPDLIICGDGSADNYAQQVDVQLASALGLPLITACNRVSIEGLVLTGDRMLETQGELVEVELPAVISVVPDAALPRIPGMKDILAAGKKPSSVSAVDNLSCASIDIVSTLAPARVDRKLKIFDASNDSDLDEFVTALKAAL